MPKFFHRRKPAEITARGKSPSYKQTIVDAACEAPPCTGLSQEGRVSPHEVVDNPLCFCAKFSCNRTWFGGAPKKMRQQDNHNPFVPFYPCDRRAAGLNLGATTRLWLLAP